MRRCGGRGSACSDARPLHVASGFMLLFALVATAPGGCTVNPVPTPGDEAADPAVPATDAGSFASEDTNKGTGGGLAEGFPW